MLRVLSDAHKFTPEYCHETLQMPEHNISAGILNIVESTWIPQRDMLREFEYYNVWGKRQIADDKRLTAFITHCGQGSTTEAIDAGSFFYEYFTFHKHGSMNFRNSSDRGPCTGRSGPECVPSGAKWNWNQTGKDGSRKSGKAWGGNQDYSQRSEARYELVYRKLLIVLVIETMLNEWDL